MKYSNKKWQKKTEKIKLANINNSDFIKRYFCGVLAYVAFEFVLTYFDHFSSTNFQS